MQATNKKGAPTQQAANAFAAQMNNARVAPHTWQGFRKPNATELLNAGNDADFAFFSVNSTQYPQRPLPLDSRDTDVAMLHDLVEGHGQAGQANHTPALITEARPYPVQDWEIQYMKDKAANEDYAAYQQWLSNKYDLNDMATRAWFKQIAPEYFSQKRELLKELMDRHAKYSLLRMAGPENEEDLRFEYAVETGRIPIPKGPFYSPIEWVKNETADIPTNGNLLGSALLEERIKQFNKTAYQYGMFNPVKPRTPAQSGWTGNINNPQDIVGNSSMTSYGFLGQNPPQNYDWTQQYQGNNLLGGRNDATFTAINTRVADTSNNGGYANTINVASGASRRPTQYYRPSANAYENTPNTYKPPTNRLWNW